MVNFDPVGVRHPEAQFLGILAHFIVVHSEAAGEDDLVHPVHRRAAKAELLRAGRERCRGGVSGNAKDDVVVRINVRREAQLPTIGREHFIGQIQITPARHLVGKQLSAEQPQLRRRSVAQPLVKDIVRVSLDAVVRVFQKAHPLHLTRVVEVDEDTHSLASIRSKDGAQQPWQAECRKDAVGEIGRL